MKRLLTICILALCCINIANAQDALCYRLPNAIERSVKQSHTGNYVIELDSSVLIDGMTVSGQLSLQNRHSLARVILVDMAGNEYLLYEGRYWGNDALVQNFEDMAIETAHMVQTSPAYLKIAINHATLNIEKISYSVASSSRKSDDSDALRSERHERLVMYSNWKSDKWRKHNAAKGVPWIAHETPESQLSYSEKKQFYGMTDDNFNLYGLEHYAGGYFVFPDTAQAEYIPRNRNRETLQFVDHFDWRDRHGKNWMTSLKNQREPNDSIHGNGGCWAFAAVATVESRLNLYYNQLLNVDLSEQEIGSCAVGNLHSGGTSNDALYYIKGSGITTETCFPFENNNTIPCSKKCINPDTLITITDTTNISKNETIVKQELIAHGPYASAISRIHHAMCLSGFGTIHVGDSLCLVATDTAETWMIISENNPYIGSTYWIYKNSYGVNHNVNGYHYAILENPDFMESNTAPTYPIRTSALSDSDIAVTDADNDGYYFWGLGPKPSHCPICCPDIPDGDDSDPTKGEMDSYGNFSTYQFPYPDIIKSSNYTDFNQDTVICSNIYLYGATMLVNANLTLNPAARIVVNGGSFLILNGHTTKATIIVKAGGRLLMQNNAVLQLRNMGCLQVELGGELTMTDDCDIITE